MSRIDEIELAVAEWFKRDFISIENPRLSKLVKRLSLVKEGEAEAGFAAEHFTFGPCAHSMIKPDCPSCCQGHALRMEKQLSKLEASTALPLRERIEKAVRAHMEHCYQAYKGVPPSVEDWVGGALHYVMWGLDRDVPLATAPTETSAWCGECGHDPNKKPRQWNGRCAEVVRDAGGSMIYCGCKCVFPASTEKAGERCSNSDVKDRWRELPHWSEPPHEASAFSRLLEPLAHALASITSDTNPLISVPDDYSERVWTEFWEAERKLLALQSAAPTPPVAQPETNIASCANCQRTIYKTGGKWFHQSSASMSCAPGIYATAIPPLNEDEIARLKGEVERLESDKWNAERVIAWIDDPNRKPAMHAFTAGNERQIAYRFEQVVTDVATARADAIG
jgi:hypothetical protein